MYKETRDVLKAHLEGVIKDACAYSDHAKRKTIKAVDVVHSLKRSGKAIYGFD